MEDSIMATATITAWQKREIERRNLIALLLGLAYRKSEEFSKTPFHLIIVRAIVNHLKERSEEKHGRRVSGFEEPDLIRDSGARGPYHPFLREVQERITEFARSDAERDALYVRLLEKMIEVGTFYITAELRSEENHEPEKIFKASSATTEVPDTLTKLEMTTGG